MTGFWRIVLLASALHFCVCATAIAAQNDIIILLANSESMRHNDPGSLTKRALDNYLQSISGNTRVAILSFADYVSQIFPFTPLDSDAIGPLIERIRSMRPEGRHSNSAAGMERSIYELKTHGRPGANKAIILITDTYIHTGDRDRDLDFARWLREILAQEAATAQIRIFGIALGEQADMQNLQTIAFKTGGDYYRASSPGEIRTLITQIHEKITGISLPPVSSTTVEQLASPVPVPPSADISTAPETDFGPTQQPPKSRDEDTAGDVMHRESSDSLAIATDPPRPESGIEVQYPLDESRRSGGLNSKWLTATQLLLAVIAISIALFGIGTYLVFRARKRPEPPSLEETQEAIPMFLCMLEDVHAITDRQYYDITGKLTWISRAPGENSASTLTIVIHDDRISRDHALIQYKKGGYWISDRNSGNGTFVNEQKISDERPLKHGDRIRFASHEFNFLWPHKEKPRETSSESYSSSLPQEKLEIDSTAYAASDQAQHKQGRASNHERRRKKADLASPIEGEDIITDIGAVDDDSVDSVPKDKSDTKELPQQRAAIATDEINGTKEDTEELPGIESEQTVAKPSDKEP